MLGSNDTSCFLLVCCNWLHRLWKSKLQAQVCLEICRNQTIAACGSARLELHSWLTLTAVEICAMKNSGPRTILYMKPYTKAIGYCGHVCTIKCGKKVFCYELACRRRWWLLDAKFRSIDHDAGAPTYRLDQARSFLILIGRVMSISVRLGALQPWSRIAKRAGIGNIICGNLRSVWRIVVECVWLGEEDHHHYLQL